MLPDVDTAARHLAEAARDGEDSPAVEAVAVNLAVQQGRLDVVNGRAVEVMQLRRGSQDALTLRDRMLSKRRFVESSRLLMLAADALMLIAERADAGGLLEGAHAGELAAPQGGVVLAHSALRALRFGLALRLIEHAPESDEKELVQAAAYLEVGTLAEKSKALDTLDRLVAQGSAEADEAALIRLSEVVGNRQLAWSKEAATWLRARGHERPAAIAEAFFLAKRHADFKAADDLLAIYGDVNWALTARLRLAVMRGNHGAMRAAAPPG